MFASPIAVFGRRVFVFTLVAWLAAVPFGSVVRAAEDRVFEMRTYITHDGRLDALHKRFREHTNRLFAKHGITPIAYWVPTDGPEAKTTLVYVLAYPSREAAEKSWQAFRDDPEWKVAKDASEKDGAIVKRVISQFLNPTDYSPIK
jgi:NIPSNAP protein